MVKSMANRRGKNGAVAGRRAGDQSVRRHAAQATAAAKSKTVKAVLSSGGLDTDATKVGGLRASSAGALGLRNDLD
ncbi:hypothetical protein [Streptomyces sp. ADI95-16]|uniref:hypothetical protein n=1 Tax=Streptomyces sp. ADI95-16 TaxID=1522758 RepID=UPI0013DE42DD|nr:hypothetical protein [Streptomyces sp. ADI95-16]